MSGDGKEEVIAVVTGGSGFVANHVIAKLLLRGYRTRATVRNPAKATHLKKAFPNLEVYEADLLKEGSFDEVVKGATYVFHTASPFPASAPQDAMKELVEPALHGTVNVLNSVVKAATVKRVVLTSSVAAVAGKKPEGHVFDENDWNYDSTASFEAYRYSKRVAEEAAWKLAKEHNLSLVVINPTFILGPPLTLVADSTSVTKVCDFFNGKFDQTAFGVVDVRDVAEAHIRAAENPNASGRYIVSSPTAVPNFELAQALVRSGQFDKYNLPKVNDKPIPYLNKFSSEKAKKELGMVFTPYETSLVDEAHALIAQGLIEKKD